MGLGPFLEEGRASSAPGPSHPTLLPSKAQRLIGKSCSIPTACCLGHGVKPRFGCAFPSPGPRPGFRLLRASRPAAGGEQPTTATHGPGSPSHAGGCEEPQAQILFSERWLFSGNRLPSRGSALAWREAKPGPSRPPCRHEAGLGVLLPQRRDGFSGYLGRWVPLPKKSQASWQEAKDQVLACIMQPQPSPSPVLP